MFLTDHKHAWGGGGGGGGGGNREANLMYTTQSHMYMYTYIHVYIIMCMCVHSLQTVHQGMVGSATCPYCRDFFVHFHTQSLSTMAGWGVAGAYQSWDRGVVLVAESLPCLLQACKHCIMCQLPQLCHFLLWCVYVDFKVGEVIDQRNSTSHFRDSELDHVAIQAFRSFHFAKVHCPGARVGIIQLPSQFFTEPFLSLSSFSPHVSPCGPPPPFPFSHPLPIVPLFP